uniref:N-acetylgalactosaminide beta-1,3-galactosyltransferase n=1 Tax=Strongyloides venezuelensis TaxID=75913 RepID=A0A0K0EZP9_STRVS
MPRSHIHLLFSPNGEIKFTKQNFFVNIKHTFQFLILLLGVFFIVRYCLGVHEFVKAKDYRLRGEFLENKTSSNSYLNIYVSPGAKKLPLKGDLFCFTITNEKYHEDKVIAINNTWLRRCNHGEIYTDSTNNLDTETPFTDLFKSLPKEFDHPFWRILIALQYSYTKVSSKFNWYLKIADDTYIIIENLKTILKKYDPNKPYYIVLLSNAYLKEKEGSYVFSRKAMDLFSKKLYKNDTLCPYNPNEIIGILECMKNTGVERLVKIVKDSLGRGRFRDWDVELGLHFKKEGKKLRNLKHSLANKQDDFGNFGTELVSLHHLTPSEMLTIDLLIYHIKPIDQS